MTQHFILSLQHSSQCTTLGPNSPWFLPLPLVFSDTFAQSSVLNIKYKDSSSVSLGSILLRLCALSHLWCHPVITIGPNSTHPMTTLHVCLQSRPMGQPSPSHGRRLSHRLLGLNWTHSFALFLAPTSPFPVFPISGNGITTPTSSCLSKLVGS